MPDKLVQKARRSVVLLLVAGCVTGFSAVPEDPGFGRTPPPPPQNTVSFSPILLYGPIVQLNGERQMTRRLSASLFGGFGGRPGDPSVIFSDAGAGVRLFPFTSTFQKGSHVGIQAAWASAAVGGRDDVTGERERGWGQVLCLAPSFGYKYTWRFGLTTEFEALFVFGRMRGEGSFLASGERPHWRGVFLPLPLWNLGWSF